MRLQLTHGPLLLAERLSERLASQRLLVGDDVCAGQCCGRVAGRAGEVGGPRGHAAEGEPGTLRSYET